MKVNLKSRRSLFAVLFAASILLAGLAPVATASAQTVCSSAHIVQPGENLFEIALANGTSWPVLQQLNNLPDANRILIGQTICLPGSAMLPPITITPPPPVTSAGLVLQLPGIFPSIDFNTQRAGPGDTIVISGVNFPTNETVDIFIAPLGAQYPVVASGSAATASNGTLSTNFTIPGDVAGVALHGWALSILVKGRVTGYYGFNFFNNTRP